MNDFNNMQPQLAYAYVPIQKLGEMYAPEEGLKRGTMFPELELPLGVYGGGILDD